MDTLGPVIFPSDVLFSAIGKSIIGGSFITIVVIVLDPVKDSTVVSH